MITHQHIINQNQHAINQKALDELLFKFFGHTPRAPHEEPIETSWVLHEDLGDILLVAAQCHDIDWVAWTLQHDLPTLKVQSIFNTMINRDRTDIFPLVKIFLPYIHDIHLNDCYSFTQACFHQHDTSAQFMLEHIDHVQHAENINKGLSNYIDMGGTGALIDQILALHDPQISITGDIILRAAKNRQVERLSTLIERAIEQKMPLEQCHAAAAMGAIAGGHFDVFEHAVAHIPDYSQRIAMNVDADEKNTYLDFHGRIEHKRLTDHVDANNTQPARTPRM